MAKKTKAPTALQLLKQRYTHITKVAQLNDKGRILRVIIACTFKGDDCSKLREIATQDAFQVQRCSPCQREFSKVRRRKVPA